MAIHTGDIIRKEVELRRLTYKEFGALIHRNEKTIPDIYDRASMATDLLITISAALRKDFLTVYYTEEPMRSLREDEVAKLQYQVNLLTDRIDHLVIELASKQELIDMQKGFLVLATERIDYFQKRAEVIQQVEKYWKTIKDAFID
jgi:hypothetical protein